MPRVATRTLPAVTVCVLAAGLVLAPAAGASTRGTITPLGFLGLPSLHDIIEEIAKGFFSALAGALVPGFLKHGTVSTIQHLVALPDPASWGHVSELESDMTYLGMSLMPVTLAVCTVRYWITGLTGAAHPVTAIGRCVGATGVLVIYRWLVEQTVAATNTLTHAILGFPVVANGLASIITVLFGGALLVGAGGVFGAFLVIVGVAFAAGLFASKVALTVLLALAFCAGPPFIALAPIPELSHLARAWAHLLMAIMLVPIGWTLLFAVAGALTLDATSFTGVASGGLPAHIAAAFAGLITFVIAVKLPLMLLGELRHILGGATVRASGGSAGGAQGQATMPGSERMRAAHARLRNVALEGVPSLGASVGRAAGAMGAPAGGPVGVARRGLAGAARRSGMLPGVAAAAGGGSLAAAAVARRTPIPRGRGGLRERLTRAGAIVASAPRDARAAMIVGSRKATRAQARAAAQGAAARKAGSSASASNATAKTPARTGKREATSRSGPTRPPANRTQPSSTAASPPAPRTQPNPRTGPALSSQAPRAAPSPPGGSHPGRKVTTSARREAGAPAPPTSAASKPPGGQQPRPRDPRAKPTRPPAAPPQPQRPPTRPPVSRRARPRRKS